MGRIAGVTAEETRTRLLKAAASVFARRGYDGASIAEITSEAGLSSGAIYAHYGSKAELLVEAIRAHGTGEVTRLLSGGGGVSVADALTVLGSHLDRRTPPSGSLLLEALVAAGRDADVAAVLAKAVNEREGLLSQFVGHGQRAGEIDGNVSPDVVARFALMLSMGALLTRILDLPQLDHDDWSSLITRVVDAFRNKE